MAAPEVGRASLVDNKFNSLGSELISLPRVDRLGLLERAPHNAPSYAVSAA